MDASKIKPVLEFSIRLNGDVWIIRKYTAVNFTRLYKDCVGITEYNHRGREFFISFKSTHISKDTIAHELMHAFLSYRDFRKRSPDFIEESVCEVVGKKWKKLFILTEFIFNKLIQKPKYEPKQRFYNLISSLFVTAASRIYSFFYNFKKKDSCSSKEVENLQSSCEANKISRATGNSG